MDLAPKATCHPLAMGEGEEGCRAVKMTPEWDAGTFSISTSWGTWAGKRMGSPVPSLLEGLAWVVGGLIPELVALGGGELQGTTPWRLQDHWWVFISHAHLFDLYMPGGRCHHGGPSSPWLVPASCPGGAVPTSRRAWQCWAACTGHVGATDRQRLCPERGQLMAAWQRAAPGLRQGLSGQSQC